MLLWLFAMIAARVLSWQHRWVGNSCSRFNRCNWITTKLTSNDENNYNDPVHARLETMKINDLKKLYTEIGGQDDINSNKYKKQELIEVVGNLLRKKWEISHSDNNSNNNNNNNNEISNQRSNYKNRNMPPLNSNMKQNNVNINNFSFNNNSETVELKYKFPTGNNRDLRLNSTSTNDMDFTFLGTASCIPSVSRGVSCIAFRYESDMWLFDCGESSQVQIQKSRVKASKIKKIFLSHAHGDHSFGLPGVLCLMGQSTQDERERLDVEGEKIEPIDIYGPEGTRDLVRSMIQLTYSRVVAPYRVHELKDVPYLHGRYYKTMPKKAIVKTTFDPYYGELEGGRDILPDENGNYHLLDEGDLVVKAAPMQHTIPCVGYVIMEKTRPGRLKVDEIKDIVEANKEELKTILKLRDANKVYARLKLMKPGEEFKFPDGTVVTSNDVLEPPRPGRKIVIMGDTCSGAHIEPLCQSADLVIHEATNAFIKEFDSKFSNYQQLERETKYHGHSTPEMAASFAKKVNAKQLILTHFSPRYRGDDTEGSMKIMWRIEDMARNVYSELKGPNDIIAAWDQLTVPVYSNR